MVAPPASSPLLHDSEQWATVAIEARESITACVAACLAHLKDTDKPLLLHTELLKSNDASHNALQRIVSVCEIIKREYRKMFLSADALKLAQEAAVAENAGLANPSLKLPPKSGHKLFQYNRLSVHSPTAALDTPVASTSARAAEGMDEDEAEVEVPDAQAAKAHDKALEEIVDKGRKRPRKKHVPKMEVVLSCRKLDWLHSTDGWSIQSPDAPMGGPVKKSTLRARAHKKQKATRRKEAKRRTGAQTGPAPVPASTAAPASTQATSVA